MFEYEAHDTGRLYRAISDGKAVANVLTHKEVLKKDGTRIVGRTMELAPKEEWSIRFTGRLLTLAEISELLTLLKSL